MDLIAKELNLIGQSSSHQLQFQNKGRAKLQTRQAEEQLPFSESDKEPNVSLKSEAPPSPPIRRESAEKFSREGVVSKTVRI